MLCFSNLHTFLNVHIYSNNVGFVSSNFVEIFFYIQFISYIHTLRDILDQTLLFCIASSNVPKEQSTFLDLCILDMYAV